MPSSRSLSLLPFHSFSVFAFPTLHTLHIADSARDTPLPKTEMEALRPADLVPELRGGFWLEIEGCQR